MFSFLKRNLIILSIAIFIAIMNGFYLSKNQTTSFHTTIFTTIANESASSSQENEQAATYFGETVMGWFRNPAFLDKIEQKAETKGSLSAHKQERQNLIIELDSDSKENNTRLAKATLDVLKAEIEFFNQNTKNKFTLLNLGTNTYENPLKNQIYFVVILVATLLVSIFLILLIEAMRGVISVPAQIGVILNHVNLLDIKFKNADDLEYLATLCCNAKKPVIFAGVDFDHSDITVQTALKAGEIEKSLILVDGDLKTKKLQKNLGLSEMMKNLKGLTDRIKKEEKLSKFVHKALTGNIHFLAAGNGTDAILEDFAEQLGEHKTILIHTIFPQNFPILTLEDFELFLFVKPGKSKIKTLEQINALQIKETKVFVI